MQQLMARLSGSGRFHAARLHAAALPQSASVSRTSAIPFGFRDKAAPGD